MRFSMAELREVLPERLPPREAVPEAVIAAYGGTTDGEDGETLRRSAFWTYAIFEALRRREWAFSSERDMPPVLAAGFEADGSRPNPSLSVGMLDPEFEAKGFGVVLTFPFAAESLVLGTMTLPELEGARFPVALRALVEDPHAAPTLSNASTACWAEDRLSPGRWGIVTCRHALTGVPVNAQVGLSGGGTGRVLRKGPPTIDAAFIGTAAPAPQPGSLPLFSLPTAGLALDVHLSAGPASRAVVSVTDTLGVIGDPYHPIKIYIDTPCSPGDSGSMVTTGGDGVGIYCGELKGATVAGKAGQTVGFAQHLEQAALILDFDPRL